MFSPSCNGYLYSKFFLWSIEYTLSRFSTFFSVSFIINSTFFIPSSSDAFITKFAPPSVVTSTFGFVTPFTSCSFVSVLLFTSTATTVNLCCPFGISTVCSVCVSFISIFVSSSSSHLYVKYDSFSFPVAFIFRFLPLLDFAFVFSYFLPLYLLGSPFLLIF